MLTTRSSHPDDQDLNVRMTSNFPENGRIVKAPGPALPTEQTIGFGRQLVVFAGDDRRAVADMAADCYANAVAPTTALSTAWGRIPFLKRLEERVPSGCILVGVPGSQVNEKKRQALFKHFCTNDPHVHVFEDLATSEYLLCAKQGFLLNFGVIATYVTDNINACFERIAMMPLLAEAEKAATGWTVDDRLKLIRIHYNGDDVTQRFQAWFHDEKIEEKHRIDSKDNAVLHAGTDTKN